MAGIATFSFKPSPAGCSGTLISSKQVSRVSLCVRFPRSPLQGGRSLAPAGVGVVARYGGGYGGRRYQREPRVPDSDYDAALDLDKLKSSSVRLLDEQQNMVGIVSIDEAMQKADDGDLILAILSPDADPPVLRLFDSNDYKKHKYEQQKKKRDQQKRSAANRQDIKELKMGYNIDSHDYSVRLKAAQRFLKDGDKVKIIVNLKGRENEFRNIAIELLKRFQSDVGELASEESKSFNERNIFMVLMPNKVALQKSQEQPKKKETHATEVS